MALTLIALAFLSLAAVWTFSRSDTGPNNLGAAKVGASILLAILLAALAKTFLKPLEQTPAVAGLGLGAVVVLAAGYLELAKKPGVVALAMGCLVSGCLLSFEKAHLDVMCLAVVVGAGSTAALVSNRTSSLTTMSVSAIALVQLLGQNPGKNAALDYVGAIGIATFTVFALLGLVVKNLKSNPLIWAILAGVSGTVALGVIGRYCFPDSADWFGLMTVPVAAVVIYWLERNNVDRPKFTLALSTIMWIGLATIAFGIQRGLGIGVAFLVSMGVLLLLDSDRTILASGPLLALVLHRAFRMEHSGVGGAIDIGQHYALIGFALAALLPLLPVEWLKLHQNLSSSVRTLSGFIWLLICLAAPCLIALFLAPKGLLGFVTGLGFCGFFAWLDLEADASVLALAAALGAASILEYGSVEKFTDLARGDKIHWFLVTAVVLALIAGLLALISSGKSRTPVAAEAA